jgi:hypothetical protein
MPVAVVLADPTALTQHYMVLAEMAAAAPADTQQARLQLPIPAVAVAEPATQLHLWWAVPEDLEW